jgi:hypothetical protein
VRAFPSSSYKVHARAVAGDSLCGAISKNPKGPWNAILADDASNITCARCLRMLRTLLSMTSRDNRIRSQQRKDKSS